MNESHIEFVDEQENPSRKREKHHGYACVFVEYSSVSALFDMLKLLATCRRRSRRRYPEYDIQRLAHRNGGGCYEALPFPL